MYINAYFENLIVEKCLFTLYLRVNREKFSVPGSAMETWHFQVEIKVIFSLFAHIFFCTSSIAEATI
jgi:hypothetical protein